MRFFNKLEQLWLNFYDPDENIESDLIKELYKSRELPKTRINLPDTSEKEIKWGLRHLVQEGLVENTRNRYSLTVTGIRYGEENIDDLKVERMMRELQRSNTRVEEDAVLELYPDHAYNRNDLWDRIKEKTLAQETTYRKNMRRIQREDIVSDETSEEYFLTELGRTAAEELFYFEED